MKQRCDYIDFLRFLGISLIVLAHVHPPYSVLQIRTFDVPLMIFISGLSYSGKQLRPSFKDYYLPRIKRLVIPSYVFLSFYFILLCLFGINLDCIPVLKSYFFLNDGLVPYMWIIRVFLLIMLVTPLLIKINNYIKYIHLFVISVLFLLLLETNSFVLIDNAFWDGAYNSIVPYILGYSMVFMFGLKVRNVSRKEERLGLLFMFLALSFFVFVLFISQNTVIEFSPKYKYPPRSVFLVYGLFVSSLLWFCRIYVENKISKLFVFVGRNTMWIYLWHIFFLLFFKHFVEMWILKYICVYVASVLVVTVQVKLVSCLRKYNLPLLRYFEG